MNNNINNIVIDASSGDVAVKSMIKNIMPNLSESGILKTVHRVLGDYNGPKMSTRLMNGRLACAATLELCFDILDKMTGPPWRKWREESGNAFKKALRERVESVRSSSQTEQLQLQPPPQPQPPTQVGIKTAVLQNALRSININGSVRIDDGLGKASIIDTTRLVCPGASSAYAAQMFTRVLEKERDDGGNSFMQDAQHPTPIADRVDYIRINGHGNVTPVSDAKTIVEIIWLLPSGAAKEFRRQSAETICRVLGGDISLCGEIEQRCARLRSTEEGRAYQSFVTDQGPAKKQRAAMPAWFEYATAEEKRAYISIEATTSIVLAKKALVLGEIDVFKTCKEELKSVGQFDQRDEIEFADRIKDVQRRATRVDNMITAAPTVDTSPVSVCVAMPVDDTIDPETGLLTATPKCSPSVRGPETSICVEAGKMGISVGEKAGQVGKVVKRLYSERYGQEAGRNIPKRSTTFRGKPFSENTYYARDSDLIQRGIRIVCAPAATP
ncbi:unnamed protein product [Ectocarpus sp. 4 AP-2014]|uniref:EsV-1-211 n=1 Tax=Ectocarpus siliculosus virus 1 (isolate New Zealand/Kaikoura/1988) TaxID=654926 RepID=Q8QN79_ESV1K|nr:EsV-1-211 [Ectocarpus siliculosus virus 1]AAK14625.1 EsV-1-211 [Ectocarpus siliculosus virus 1]